MSLRLVLHDAADEVDDTLSVNEFGHVEDDKGNELPDDLVVFDADGNEHYPEEGEVWLKLAPQLFRTPYLVPVLEEE